MIPILILRRFFDDGVTTLGLLDGKFWTVERPWLDNQLRISCIPTGEYKVKRHISPSKGTCYSVEDVPGRTHILIHVANWSHELMGCIAPGVGVALTPTPMVTTSRNALNAMFNEYPDEFELEITA